MAAELVGLDQIGPIAHGPEHHGDRGLVPARASPTFNGDQKRPSSSSKHLPSSMRHAFASVHTLLNVISLPSLRILTGIGGFERTYKERKR